MVVTFSPTRLLLPTTLALAALLGASVPASAQDAKHGETVYTAQKCQTCHAIAGKGGKASALDGVGAKMSAEDIRLWITNPTEAAAKAKSTKKPAMPNKYGKLAAADIDGLVAYMQSLK